MHTYAYGLKENNRVERFASLLKGMKLLSQPPLKSLIVCLLAMEGVQYYFKYYASHICILPIVHSAHNIIHILKQNNYYAHM